MPAAAVVVREPAEQLAPGLCLRGPAASVKQFSFEALEERLGQGVVLGRAGPVHASADAAPAADVGEGGRAVLGALSVWKTTSITWLPRAAPANSIASVVSEVRMGSQFNRPTMRGEQMSVTAARLSQVVPTVT